MLPSLITSILWIPCSKTLVLICKTIIILCTKFITIYISDQGAAEISSFHNCTMRELKRSLCWHRYCMLLAYLPLIRIETYSPFACSQTE